MSLQYVKGIGPKRTHALKDIGIDSIAKLLYYFPRDYLDRSRITRMKDLPKYVEAGVEVTVIGTVFRTEVKYTRKRKSIFFLTLKDETGFLTCVFYAGIEWYKDAFVPGEVIAVSSVPQYDRLNRIQFIHPEFDRLAAHDEEDDTDWNKLLHTGAIIPKYHSSEELRRVGLDNRGFRRIIKSALQNHLHLIIEHLPADLLSRNRLIPLQESLRKVHFPRTTVELDEAVRRLKFDELFYFQLLLAYRKKELQGSLSGIAHNIESKLLRSLMKVLPFELTGAQQKVIREISQDMKSPIPMNRLLQGDVGSGKTIVALSAMLIAVDNGYQAVLMAPTEILAEQHFRSLSQFLEGLNVNIRLLIGGQKKRLREDILEDIKRGSAHIVVGTHALVQEPVEYGRLGLVIVDEQHRFGVVQRSVLREKSGLNPDVLVMTATPIPRTLALTMYGDLDVSVIDEMPKGRRAIRTAVRTEKEKKKVFHFVREEIQHGRQAYIVYPLIEESEKVDLKSAVAEFERLQSEEFPGCRVGLLHGRLPSEEKDRIMHDFKNRKIDILVATTVIEVGIDVPNASIMIIENAERFGLSQLHQLRGRVGRGADQSYCILLSNELDWKKKLLLSADRGAAIREVDAAKTRLETMVQTTDGFRIAEVDLKLRGMGEFFGTRQSGMPEFKMADITSDSDLIDCARSEAFSVVNADPHLRHPHHQKIREQFETVFKKLLSFVRTG